MTETQPDNRTPDQINAELEATRARLAGGIDELQAYFQPKALITRQVESVKGCFVDEFGGVRPDRVLIAVGAVAGVLTLCLLRRRARS